MAYDLARASYKWHKYPPGYVPAPAQEYVLPEKEAGKEEPKLLVPDAEQEIKG